MSKLIRSLVVGVFAASLVATTNGAEPGTCVDDDQQTCPDITVTENAAAAVDDDSALTPEVNVPAVSAPVDQTPSVTVRTIGPPIVVESPFSQAAPAAAQTEDVRPRAAGEQQPLPPGPPNRLP